MLNLWLLFLGAIEISSEAILQELVLTCTVIVIPEVLLFKSPYLLAGDLTQIFQPGQNVLPLQTLQLLELLLLPGFLPFL
jgi:hypothetical protein